MRLSEVAMGVVFCRDSRVTDTSGDASIGIEGNLCDVRRGYLILTHSAFGGCAGGELDVWKMPLLVERLVGWLLNSVEMLTLFILRSVYLMRAHFGGRREWGWGGGAACCRLPVLLW